MKYILLIIMLLPVFLYAQDTLYKKDRATGKTEVFYYVEKMAKANYNVDKYLLKRLQTANIIKNNSDFGEVIIQFVVEADGSISNPKIITHVSNTMDSVLKSIVINMPKWEPAMYHGKNVASPWTLPIYIDPE